MLDRPFDDFTRNPSRPFRFECEKIMDGLNIQAVAVGGYFELATLPLNDLHAWTRAVHDTERGLRQFSLRCDRRAIHAFPFRSSRFWQGLVRPYSLAATTPSAGLHRLTGFPERGVQGSALPLLRDR